MATTVEGRKPEYDQGLGRGYLRGRRLLRNMRRFVVIVKIISYQITVLHRAGDSRLARLYVRLRSGSSLDHTT